MGRKDVDMQKRFLIIVGIVAIVIGVVIFGIWYEQREEASNVGKILNSAPLIDTISVKDGKTNEEIMNLTKINNYFTATVEIYKLPYKDMSGTEKKILKEKSYLEVLYLQDNKIKYIVSIYQIDNEKLNKFFVKDDISDEYIYKSELDNTSYIFVLKDTNHLLGVNNGFKDLLDSINRKAD